MSTDELRQKLVEIHKGRGKLKALCKRANVDYKNVWKFTSEAVKKIDLDIASKLIAVLLQTTSEKEITQHE